MTITAQSADGLSHEFPDGTDPSVIDKVMKDYAMQQAPAAQAPEGKSLGGFVSNVGSDAYNTAEGIVSGLYAGGKKLVTDPVGAGKDIFNAGDQAGAVLSGGLGHLYNAAVPQGMEMTPGPDMALASKVGGALKDRYWDNLGNTVYEHPVQSALDASTLLYGGEGMLGRALGEGAMATKVVGKAASLTNPLNIVAKPVQGLRGAFAERSALREMRQKAPTQEWVKTEKNALYDALDNSGIKFDANSYEEMLGRLSEKLRTFRAKRAPMTSDAVEAMLKHRGSSPTFRDVEEMLIEAKGILREHSATNADKTAAGKLLDELNPFFNNSPLVSNGRIAAGDVAAVAKEARDLSRRHILAREAGEIDRKSKWYTSGDESGQRNQFATFGKRQGKSLTAIEERAAKKVVRREGVHGLLNTGGSKLTQTILLGGLGWNVGIPAALLGAALSTGSRAASAAMTNAKAKQFIQTVLAGKEAQAAALAKAKRFPFRTKGALLGAEGASLLTGRP